VRIEFKMEGGIAYFPGLSKPVSVDTDQLPEEERGELEELVKEARFFDLPSDFAPPRKKGADYYQYRITIEARGQRHTVNLTDPVETPGLQKLVSFLRRKSKEILSGGRKPGTGE
jgi:hypothetical protein